MHTLLFLYGPSGSTSHGIKLLEHSSATVGRIRPYIGEENRPVSLSIGAQDGGYWIHRPASVTLPDRIDEARDEVALILAWGESYGGGGSLAGALLRAWHRGGPDAVRLINGSFAALVVDLTTDSVHLVSDTVGKRTFRYAVADESIAVSTHDLPIVATGLIPLHWDLVSAASLLACGWSMGGHALIEGIRVCSPHEVVTWRKGRLKATFKPLIHTEPRLKRRDRQGITVHLNRMIETMQSSAKVHAGSAGTVRCDLTAGFDSRAVLGIVHSVVEARRIELSTSETIDPLDARVAADIARRLGLAHNRFEVNDAGGAFVKNCRLRAFLMNGATNGRRALGAWPRIEELAVPHYYGGGGEIHRGFYYPRGRLDYHLRILKPEAVKAHIGTVALAHGDQSVLPVPMINGVRERMEASLSNLQQISGDPADLADLFYLYEKYGLWGSYASRLTWKNWMSPFELPAVVRMAFRLPSPIGKDCLLHKRIIGTLLPGACRIPINDKLPIPLLGDALPRVVLRAVLARLKPASRSAGPGRQWTFHTDLIRKYLENGLRDLLLADASIGCAVIGKEGLTEILDAEWGHSGQQLRTVGFLLTMEMFREMAAECRPG